MIIMKKTWPVKNKNNLASLNSGKGVFPWMQEGKGVGVKVEELPLERKEFKGWKAMNR